MDRFSIQYDERGVQLHNDYIGKIADGIVEFWKRRETRVHHPEQIYGMICYDRKILLLWEAQLKKEGLL